MNVAASPLRLLDRHTWIAVLLIGVGFGIVATLALGLEGRPERTLLVAAVPVVLGYNALVLGRRRDDDAPHIPAIVANVVLGVTAVSIATHDVTVLLSSDPLHLLVATGLAMSVLLQASVLVVAAESVRRLRTRGGSRVSGKGDS